MSSTHVLPVPASTYQLLRDAAHTWPDAVATQWIPDPAAYTDCLTWTYTDLASRVTQIANALTALGVRRADAVTLCGINTSMLYVATLAAQAVGIAAPVNPVLSAEHVAQLIRRTGSRVLVAAGPELDEALWQRLLAVCADVGVEAVLALRPDTATGAPPPLPAVPGVNVAYLDDAIAGQPVGRLAGARPPAPDDLAAFVHTGGTTGAPKIAAHTHANQLACGFGIATATGLALGEAMLGGLPLFHVNALIVTGIAPMFAGLRVVWPGPAGYRDPSLYARFWKLVEHYRIAAMSAVPTVYASLSRAPVDADISSLRLPIVGASPLPPSVREGFAAHTGRRLLEGYGLTEATCATTFTPPGGERAGSVGRALAGQQVKAVHVGEDGSWTDCAPGEVGVLAIGGPAVFAGYVTDPAEGGPRVSRDGVVHDGWLNTGDLGRVEPDGYVHLAGRAKDLIIRGGHNIDPRVVEDGLLRHPAVRAAAAVGRPDRHSGEVPVAYVVPSEPDRFDEGELLAWAATAIGEPAARPKRIHSVPEIPTTAVGKQYKPALVADAAARAISDVLADAGIPARSVSAGHQDGRLVVTVAGADPQREQDTAQQLAAALDREQATAEHPRAVDEMKTTLARLAEALDREQDTAQQLAAALDRERAAVEHLRAVDEMKTTFLQAVSHDLRTPLTTILGIALTLERGGAGGLPAEEVADLLHRLSSNARKLDGLLGDLLDLDRLARGALTPHRQMIDIGALVRRVVEDAGVNEQHAVVVDAPALRVAVDAPKVERIMENLVVNAARHTTAGTTIWVCVQPHDGGVLLLVEDEGPGVPAQLREQVFQPFHKGRNIAGHAPGSGIGLAVVAQFASLHGGRAWVQDRPGGGASFRVFLPGVQSLDASST